MQRKIWCLHKEIPRKHGLLLRPFSQLACQGGLTCLSQGMVPPFSAPNLLPKYV